MVVQFIILFTLSTLICRGTDILKCFSESLEIRDNESRLYIDICQKTAKGTKQTVWICRLFLTCNLSHMSAYARNASIFCFVGKYMQGGVVGSREEKARALTAYVLVSMLESFKMMRERTPVSMLYVEAWCLSKLSQGMTKPTIRLVWPAKTQIIHAVWSESLLYSLQAIQRGDKPEPCHTRWMYWLIWIFAGSICIHRIGCVKEKKVL